VFALTSAHAGFCFGPLYCTGPSRAGGAGIGRGNPVGSLFWPGRWCVLRPALVIDLVIQMEMSSLLTLNELDRAIGDFLVGLPV
jgi:hypothetical protein